MDKKLLTGIASLAVVGGFWACGDGAINEMNGADTLVSMLYEKPDDQEGLKNKAFESCKADIGCSTQYGAYLNGEEPVEVSSSSQDTDTPPMSSQGQGGVLPPRSSSSFTIGIRSSAVIEDPGLSSSGDPLLPSNPTSGLGSCAPVTSPISKNGSTKWKFTPNTNAGYKPLDFAKATFGWSFGAGASPENDNTPNASKEVTYANSGSASASLNLLMPDGASETIKCAPLQVNGAPITGCKCTPTAETVDVAAGGAASWTVDGCVSVGQEITGYTWVGATGAGQTATYAFTEKGQTLAPKVKVANDDNTVQEFTCGEVKAIDTSSPDYLIEAVNTTIALPAGDVTVSLGTAVPASPSSCSFSCNADGSIDLTVAGSSGSGDYYVSVPVKDASACGGGKALSITLSKPGTCSLNAW